MKTVKFDLRTRTYILEDTETHAVMYYPEEEFAQMIFEASVECEVSETLHKHKREVEVQN